MILSSNKTRKLFKTKQKYNFIIQLCMTETLIHYFISISFKAYFQGNSDLDIFKI